MMNKLRLFITLIIVASLLQACKGIVSNENADSISATDSMQAVEAHARLNVPLTAEDAQFVMQMASSGLKEIALGKLAQTKAQNKRVKNFGGMMAKDITKTLGKLQLLAKNKKISLPSAPLPADEKTIDSLNALSGKAFDKAYVNTMIAGRKKYLALFEGMSKNGMDPDIKLFATKTLTPVKNHLEAITTISESMK